MLSMFMPHAVNLWGRADGWAWGGLHVMELKGFEMGRERAFRPCALKLTREVNPV